MTLLAGFNPTNSDITRIKRQINFPLEENFTNLDGCPPRLPCYFSPRGVCVEVAAGTKCPNYTNGWEPKVFEEIKTPEVTLIRNY